MLNNTQRLAYLDDAKAFGIWLMVLGHYAVPETLHRVIYSFHMPLFFVISGMFFRPLKPLTENLRGAVKTILLPYLLLSIINLSICWIHPYLHPELYYGMAGWRMFTSAVFGIFLGVDQVTPYSYMPVGPLWFLVAMFLCRVICAMLYKWLRNEYISSIMVLLVAALGICLSPSNLFSIKSAAMALPFYVMGFLIAKVDYKRLDKYFIPTIIGGGLVILSPLNGQVELDGCLLGDNVLLTYLTAFLGSMAVINICARLADFLPNVIHAIGAATLAILGLHSFVDVAVKVISTLTMGSGSLDTLWYAFIASTIIVVATYYLSRPIVKRFPILVGK